jgi:hypothetical protein
MCPIFLSALNKFGFSRQIFIKVLSIKFRGNPSSGADTYTDRQDEADRRLLLLRKQALRLKLSNPMLFPYYECNSISKLQIQVATYAF